MDLELATTEELIKELYNRKTFAGAIVYSTQEHTLPTTPHDEFKLLFTIHPDDLLTLLNEAIEAIHKAI